MCLFLDVPVHSDADATDEARLLEFGRRGLDRTPRAHGQLLDYLIDVEVLVWTLR